MKHVFMNANGKYVVKFGSSHNWSDLRHIMFISFGCDVYYINHLHFLKANLSWFSFSSFSWYENLRSSTNVNGINVELWLCGEPKMN